MSILVYQSSSIRILDEKQKQLFSFPAAGNMPSSLRFALVCVLNKHKLQKSFFVIIYREIDALTRTRWQHHRFV